MHARMMLAALLCLPGMSLAQDLSSGPEKAKAPPALKVFDATGPYQGKEIDYVDDRKDKPTIYLFVRQDAWDRPMARFVRTLDEAISKAGNDASVVAVWLTDDVDKTKEYLPKAQQSLRLQVSTLSCFPGKKDGPEGWGINSDAHITVVLAAKGKVAETYGYRSINDTEVRKVMRAFEKARATK